MKIFRAIQISLKEFRHPNSRSRFISTHDFDASADTSPCEYKVKNKVKSKEKSKRSKLSKHFKNIRKFNAPGSLEEITLKSTPHSGFVFNSFGTKEPCPILISYRHKTSYQNDKLSCKKNLEENSFYVLTTDKELPVTNVNLLEASRCFRESDRLGVISGLWENGSTPVERITIEDHELVHRNILNLPGILEILNPKMLSKLAVEEMLRLICSSAAKLNLVEQYEEARVNAVAETSIHSKCNCKDIEQTKSYTYFYHNEITKTLQYLRFFTEGSQSENKSISKYQSRNGSRDKILSMRPILTHSSDSDMGFLPRSNNMTCYQYHTVIEPLKILISSKSQFAFPNSRYLHMSRELSRAEKIGQDEWLMQSKRIANSESELIKGGNAFVASTNSGEKSDKYEEPINMNEFKPTKQQIGRKCFFGNEPEIPHAVVMTSANSFASSQQEDQPDTVSNTNASDSTLDREGETNDTSSSNNQEPLSFRSSLSPEFVRPKISSYELQFDEDSAPHVAMLYSFCSPLPIGSQRENIIPIQIVEDELTIGRRVSNGTQGLWKSILDKINLLKWN